MKLHVINTGLFKLDGGAMFGVVPKSIWSNTNIPDSKNMCTWAMRCLLIEDGKRLILIDTGIGNKQSEKFFGFYDLHGDDTLDRSLQSKGFSRDDITDVFLTHLHFDHCGGSIQWNNTKTGYEPAFKNAVYWSNLQHWEWAVKPNAREKASFLKENILPIQESGQLKFVSSKSDAKQNVSELGNYFDILVTRGHTDAMMIPHINYKGRTVVFMADLLPSAGHIPLPYIMAYDTRPLLTLQEKELFMNEAAQKDYVLFFEHDPINECCTIQQTERGVRLKQAHNFNELLG
ncbi:MAG: MBL fold metallo-hydrolase [Bacteroidia bacterium]|nr:MBL fold metallo-hydrolase [Bacteroidia bacterium]